VGWMIKMGGRYYLTGTQLGMLKAYCQIAKTEPNKTLETLELLEELLQKVDKQFIGEIPNVGANDYEIVIRKKVRKVWRNEKEK
jgi:hypothetical protein